MKKVFYNNLDNALLKPHAPYLPYILYKQEQVMMKCLREHQDYTFIEDQRNNTVCPDDTAVLIHSHREASYGDNRWKVPELYIPKMDLFKQQDPSNKIVLCLECSFDDPQVYIASFKEQALFCENHRNIWNHPMIGVNETKLFEDYFARLYQKVGTFDKKIEGLIQIKESLGAEKMLVPLLYLETYRANGLEDTKGIFFIKNPLPVESKYIYKDVIDIKDRQTQCFFSGAVSKGIYPLRSAFEIILSKMNDLKIHNNNQTYREYLKKRSEWVSTYNKQIETGVRAKNSDYFLNRAFETLDEAHYEGYMQKLGQSKIAVCCASIFGYPLKKYWEAMSQGCVVVGQLPKYAEKYGIVDGVHMVSCDIDSFEKTIRNLLQDEKRMNEISKNARQLVIDQYTDTSYANYIMQKCEI
jgi:hypothetical protein